MHKNIYSFDFNALIYLLIIEWESFADYTLLGLQFCMGDACLGRHSALFPLSHGRASKSLLRWFLTKVRNPSGAMTSTASPH